MYKVFLQPLVQDADVDYTSLVGMLLVCLWRHRRHSSGERTHLRVGLPIRQNSCHIYTKTTNNQGAHWKWEVAVMNNSGWGNEQ